MNTISKVMMLLVAVSFAAPVFAQEGNTMVKKRNHHRNVEQRVANQQRRIEHKEAKGKMTAEQAQAERSKIDNVASERAEMVKANGGKPLTKEQRKGLNKELNQTSKEIKGSGMPAAATPASTN